MVVQGPIKANFFLGLFCMSYGKGDMQKSPTIQFHPGMGSQECPELGHIPKAPNGQRQTKIASYILFSRHTMLKYTLTAVALRIFSLNKVTRHLYRAIGNLLANTTKRNNSVATYISRGDLLVNILKGVRSDWDNHRFLELGTGWVHWYSIYLSLHYKLNISMFDVWDNRQFDIMVDHFNKLRSLLPSKDPRIALNSERLDFVCSATNFKDIYRKLNLTYTINDDGGLGRFLSESYDAVFSFHVLEHIPASIAKNHTAKEIFRILKPGGYSIHQVGIDDHLAHYDRNVSPKQYLQYSDRVWTMFFENKVQYINRIQASEWLDIFKEAGFDECSLTTENIDLTGLRIASKYKGISHKDLSCTILTIVHRKPLDCSSVNSKATL